MFEAFLKVLPIFFVFFLGYVLKKFKIFKFEDGGLLLKLNFFTASPALIYLSVSSLDITTSLLAFPAIATLTIFILHFVNSATTKNLDLPRQTLGVYRIGTLIANTAFTLPFLLAIYGQEAAARVAMHDLAGGFLTFIFIYSIAVRHGDEVPDKKYIMRKVLIAPPVWALLVGLTANLFHFQTPEVVASVLQNLANLVSPLVILALGMYFSPRLLYPKLIGMALFTRMVGGFAIGYGLSSLFGLTGWEKAAAVILASAPIGFNTLTYANMEKLDTKFAASLLSCAIGLGLVIIPLLTVIFAT